MRTPQAKLLLGAVLAALLLLPATAGAHYRDVIAATPGLITQWRLGDTTATGAPIATDSTGLQDGSYTGTPNLGVAGWTRRLDADRAVGLAAGSSFTAPNRSEYANAQTVEFWVNLQSYGDTTKYRAMASKGYDVSQRNWLIALGSGATGQLTYGFGSGGTAVGRRSTTTLALNTWYLIDYVHTSTGVNLYINGTLDSTLSSTATPVVGTDPVILGDDGQTGYTADAQYDELSLYGGALTSTQVAAHYAAGNDPAAICDKVAATTGSDTTGNGTVARPYLTSNKLASSLTSGQTGCFRRGTYANTKLRIANDGITLQTYPGEATATLSGAVWVWANNVTVQELKLDSSGTSTTEATSPTINGDGDVLRYDDITNNHASRICVDTSTYLHVSSGYTIERNRIHDCGTGATVNQQHGIYLEGTGGTVQDNAIFDNNDRGVQLYPNADGNHVDNNTIDGNGEGFNFGADASGASDSNDADNNIISNAARRWLIETNYTTPPSGAFINTLSGNCLYATLSGYTTNNGIDPYANGISVTGSIVGDPLYKSRSTKDFTLTSTSPCLGKGAPRDVAAPW
jgi:parallel beta-helix repeat protein